MSIADELKTCAQQLAENNYFLIRCTAFTITG